MAAADYTGMQNTAMGITTSKGGNFKGK